MMRLGRRASLLVAFYLLTSAATANAECAWVLWSHFMLLVNYAFESTADCKAAAAAVLREAARRGNTVVGGHVTTASGDLSPVCLPDTVDPRGPKGK